MQVEIADLENPEVVDLVRFHHAEMQRNSPPDMCFPLDLEGLRDPRVTVLAVRLDGRVAAIGAMKRLDAERIELKSMRTHPDFVRRGLAGVLLDAIIERAIIEGFAILSLETGSGPHFDAALALYRKRGFENGEAFAGYANTAFNQCLHLSLA
ncbi:GNAT family N-acetyltransferase [Parerythrobacter aestuarii]|uniref:GNAT family N-acetyltransferase n=1 Tax=Parerythrobacter aestuarii TaxID=3020909 RepID=UPI0024DE38E3|nr:GNAT family N-acetyltransferase [Parerythrobacter aestuarii]